MEAGSLLAEASGYAGAGLKGRVMFRITLKIQTYEMTKRFQ